MAFLAVCITITLIAVSIAGALSRRFEKGVLKMNTLLKSFLLTLVITACVLFALWIVILCANMFGYKNVLAGSLVLLMFGLAWDTVYFILKSREELNNQ